MTLVTTVIILIIRFPSMAELVRTGIVRSDEAARIGDKPSHHIIIIIIIIITRPKPAYGRHGLAGSWGQDTDEVSTFLVFLTSHFAPAALSSDLTNLGPLLTMKIHLETLKNHGNQPKTMKLP